MFDTSLVYKHIPRIFGVLAFIVNPIFVYLIFTEKTAKLGNYRYVLLYFAVFNLVYSIANVIIPIDIHSYRYCFYIFINDGFFIEKSNWNLHVLTFRCALISASYAVLLSHFLYRYLIIRDSSLIRENFHIYMIISAGILFLYTFTWHAIDFYLADANLETREYIGEDFKNLFGIDSTEVNMLTCLYNEGTGYTVIRSWSAAMLCIAISVFSICAFLIIACMIMKTLNKTTDKMSRKSSKQQIELLRALIVQTINPILISFLPCVFGLFSPAFNLDLGRPINYVEVIALGAFAFCDPVAIVICLPVFRQRVMCQKKQSKRSCLSKTIETIVFRQRVICQIQKINTTNLG